MLDDDVLVAWEYDGQPVEPIHGGPVRMLVPKLYFWKKFKWLAAHRLHRSRRTRLLETRGYNNNADPWKEERYADLPRWMDRINGLGKIRT